MNKPINLLLQIEIEQNLSLLCLLACCTVCLTTAPPLTKDGSTSQNWALQPIVVMEPHKILITFEEKDEQNELADTNLEGGARLLEDLGRKNQDL